MFQSHANPDPSVPATSAAGLERLRGTVDLAFKPGPGGRTVLDRFYQEGSGRARLPRSPAGMEAVLINTGGGLTGGDRFQIAVTVRAGCTATVTGQAAEKIYRSSGGEAEIATRLRVGAGARLEWLPQETILFDGARLSRRLDADIEGDGALLLVESTVFGRTARGETVRRGLFRDRWRVRRDGRLAYADAVCLAGDIDAALARRAVADGARAVGTLVYLAPQAEGCIDRVRGLAEGAGFAKAGASAWPGILVSRFMAADGKALKDGLVRLLEGWRGAPPPRVWSC